MSLCLRTVFALVFAAGMAAGVASERASGHLDQGFGRRGVASFGGTSNSEGFGIAIDANGRIFATGNLTDDSVPRSVMAVWCFRPDGTPDTSFGGTGVVTHFGAAGTTFGGDQGKAVAIDTSGRVVVAGGSVNANTDTDLAIWRFLADGSLDLSFGGTGYVTRHDTAGGTFRNLAFAVRLDAGGRIVVAGESSDPLGSPIMAVWRYNPDGSPDQTFGGAGFAVDAPGGVLSAGLGLAVDPSGRVVVSGYRGFPADLAVWRFNPDGSPDPSFNGTGLVTHDSAAGGSYFDIGNSVAIDTAGRIVVGGNSAGPNFGYEMTVWRFNPNGTLDPSLGGTGYVIRRDVAGGVNGSDWGSSLALDAEGNILLAGFSPSARPEMDNDLTLLRLHPDGSTDHRFASNGVSVKNEVAGGPGEDYAWGMALDAGGRILLVGTSTGPAGNSLMVVLRFK